MDKLTLKATGNVFIGTDIHGCLDLLFEKLISMKFDPEKDIFVCGGDLIDRGPKSNKVLKLLRKKWFYSVMGNHDKFALDALTHGDKYEREEAGYNWMANGGTWYAELNEANRIDVDQLIKDEVSKLPYIIEIETLSGQRVGIAHANLPFNAWKNDWSKIPDSLTKNQKQFITWDRGLAQEAAWYSKHDPERLTSSEFVVDGIDHIYYGHTPFKRPVTIGNQTFIDTKAFKTNNLTIIKLD